VAAFQPANPFSRLIVGNFLDIVGNFLDIVGNFFPQRRKILENSISCRLLTFTTCHYKSTTTNMYKFLRT
jgi:hypothetical protein